MAVLVARLVAVAEWDALRCEEAAEEGAHRKDLVTDQLEEATNLPLRHGAEAKARHVNEGTQVHGHDQIGARGVREDEARILRRDARLHEIPVETERTLRRLFESSAHGLVRLRNGSWQHRGRLLEGDVSLRLLVEGDARAVSDELMA